MCGQTDDLLTHFLIYTLSVSFKELETECYIQ